MAHLPYYSLKCFRINFYIHLCPNTPLCLRIKIARPIVSGLAFGLTPRPSPKAHCVARLTLNTSHHIYVRMNSLHLYGCHFVFIRNNKQAICKIISSRFQINTIKNNCFWSKQVKRPFIMHKTSKDGCSKTVQASDERIFARSS